MHDRISSLRQQLVEAKKRLEITFDEITAPDHNASENDERLLAEQEKAVDRLIDLTEKAVDIEERERKAAALLTAGPSPAAHAASDIIVTKDPADRPFKNFGEQLQAIRHAGTSGAALDPRLAGIQAASGASEGVASDGGFLVQQDFSAEIFARASNTGSLLSRVRRIPISANSNGIRIPRVAESARTAGNRWGGVQSDWVDEGAAATATKPTFERLNLELKKQVTLAYVTDELLSDAVALEAIYSQAFAEEITFGTEAAIFSGDGVGKPKGITESGALVVQAKESGQTAATVVLANVVKMWSRCPASMRSDPNTVWLINQDVESQLYTMTLANQPMYWPAGSLSQGAPVSRLMGQPVVPIEHCETLGTQNDIVLAALGQYVMIDKGAPESASSMHVKFAEDEHCFRMVYRCDGDSLFSSAVTPAKGSSTVSPFISLAVRS